LSPRADFVEVAACKYACYQRWREAGVPTIETHRLPDSAAWAHLRDVPVVTKPIDGAGSDQILCWNRGREIPRASQLYEEVLIQPKITGTPSSCAVLASGDSFVVLPGGYQKLGNDFKFLGGSLPL